VELQKPMICFADMHEALKSNGQRNVRCSSYADEQQDFSALHVPSLKLVVQRGRGDTVKSVAATQSPSTKLGLYKALQPLLKLASPSTLDRLLFCVLSTFPFFLHILTCCRCKQKLQGFIG